MSDLYFNTESYYSEENANNNEDFGSTILRLFQSEPEQKKTCGNESHEKETTEAVSRFQVFFKMGVLKNFANFTGKHMRLESLFNTVAGLQACNFIKKRLNTGNTFFAEHLNWLLFKLKIYMLQLRIYYILE